MKERTTKVGVATMDNNSRIKIIGMKINPVQISDVVKQMESWITSKEKSHYITVSNAHTAVECLYDEDIKDVINTADFSVPDGMPLVWLAKHKGYDLKRRVYGPELLLAFCEAAATKGYTNFFYGGAEGVPEQLAKNLKKKFPGLKVVGTHSPPFRALTEEEDKEVIKMINDASPDVLWVGLGCPKQERWMHDHKDKLNVQVMVGVGAAFDFFAGGARQAPRWMQENGLEWLFRLFTNPRRLWKRYLVYGPIFAYNVFLELAGLRKFNGGKQE